MSESPLCTQELFGNQRKPDRVGDKRCILQLPRVKKSDRRVSFTIRVPAAKCYTIWVSKQYNNTSRLLWESLKDTIPPTSHTIKQTAIFFWSSKCSSGSDSTWTSSNPVSKRQHESKWIHAQRKCQSLMEEQPTCNTSVLVIMSASELWLRIQERYYFQISVAKVARILSINTSYLFVLPGWIQ